MVSLSDSYSWNCDALFAMIRSKDMKESKELKIKTLAIREGEPFDVVLNWDFDRMDFSEKRKIGDEKFQDTGFKSDKGYFSKGYSRAPSEKDYDDNVVGIPGKEVVAKKKESLQNMLGFEDDVPF